MLDSTTKVGIVGAGAMGSGIAQVAAAAGHSVIIADAMAGAAQRAKDNLAKVMEREVSKDRLTGAAADELLARITFHDAPLGEDVSIFAQCGLVIEAIVEDLDVKRALFKRLDAVVDAKCVLATNTSSLSVASIA